MSEASVGKPQLAHCEVFHGRTLPRKHTFRYKIAYLVFDTQDASFKAKLARKFHGVLSLRARDYLDSDLPDFDAKIRTYLKTQCAYEPDSIRLMTLPRMFGYGFNPISFWLCYRESRLNAVLTEVNNTFGERHCYWIKPDDGAGFSSQLWLQAKKVFHVSPFFAVDGYYEFRFHETSEEFQFDIRYKGDDGVLRLATYLKGRYEPLSSTSFSKFFLRYGWISFAVIARIHYQALHLWRKKASFFKKPAPPTEFMSGTRKDFL